MPTLNQCVAQIEELVNEKGFNADPFFFKMVWAVVELAEALDITKKTGLQFPPELAMSQVGALAEELIDVIFYTCDAYRLLQRRYPWILTMDGMFNYKMHKNMNREEQYGAGILTGFMKTYVDHMHEEGKLFEFLNDINNYATKIMHEEKLADKHKPLP